MEVFSRKRACSALHMLFMVGRGADVLRAHGSFAAHRLHSGRRHRPVRAMRPPSACVFIAF